MNSEIARKIKKLFELAKSKNANEAAAAIEKAKALMEKYGLNEKQISASVVTESKCVFRRSSNPPQWLINLSNTVAKSFGVRPLIHESFDGCTFSFIGVTPKDEIAQYTMDILYRHLSRARSDYMKTLWRYKRRNKTIMADNFAIGWVQQINKTVRKFAGILKDDEKAIEDFITIHYPELNDYNPRSRGNHENNWMAFQSGRTAAEGVSLNHGIQGANQRNYIGAQG